MMAPAGAEAAALHEVTVVLFVGAALILAGVLVLLGWSLRARPRRPVATGWWVLGGGVVFPVVVLSALLVYSTARTAGLEHGLVRPAVVVGVAGRLWWWEVRYRHPAGGPDIIVANELRIPVGEPTQVALSSADVIHSLWVPELGGKRDLVPGRVNHLVFTPRRAGVYRGECAEFCGLQHAKMALHVVAMPRAEFDRWLAGQGGPAIGGAAGPGPQAFLDHGCAACHSLRGLAEGVDRGPDLTHVGSRTSLGAGTLRNEPGAMKRWLVDVQKLKPGARMPSYGHLDAATLDALAAWLERSR
jgi:cytochrome c oxidase subunit 2